MDNGLQFAHIEYSIQTKSIDIFSIGCDGNCKGCCNPEIKDFNLRGKDALQVISKVVELTTKYGRLIDRILLVGGDPVDAYYHYPKEYLEFVQSIRTLDKPIYLFTRYEVKDIPVKLLKEVDYVKTGLYIPELKTENHKEEGIKLATSNQHIYKVTNILEELYGNNKVCR